MEDVESPDLTHVGDFPRDRPTSGGQDACLAQRLRAFEGRGVGIAGYRSFALWKGEVFTHRPADAKFLCITLDEPPLGRDAAAPESLVRTKTGRAEWLSGIVRGIRSSNTIDRSQDITLIPTMHFLERNPQLWMLNALIE